MQQQGECHQLGKLHRVEVLQERWGAGVTISQMRLLQHHLIEGKIVDIYHNAALSAHLPIAIEDIVLLMITNAGSSLAKV